VPSQDRSLFNCIHKQFRAHANKELLRTDKEESYSYSDIDKASARIANSLTDAGAVPGDRVSALLEKSPQALSLYLACLRGGFVFHPMNPACQPAELEFFIGDTEPSVIVSDSAHAATIRPLAEKAGIPSLHTLQCEGNGSAEFDPVQRAEDDLAALLYSSGTTGVPKGIMLTHGNLLSNADALMNAWEFSENDRLLHALPVFHVHGLFVATHCVLLSGASMRWLPEFDAERAIGLLPECTVMMGVPTYYTRMLAQENLSTDTCGHMRVFISGSAPLLEETFREFESRTGHRILERYGMTETGMNTSNPLHGERKPGTVGLPLPGVEIRIADEIGNLQVRGPNVFAGYWKLPDKTAEDFTVDGFFNTGDLGRIDEDGYVSITGRSKDLVISGGLNVYPKEVELILDKLPGIRESAVIGVPHADLGEAAIAIVVTEDGVTLSEAAVIESSKRGLANYKVPKRVVFVDELPRNPMSKIQKQTLRETYKKLFA
jgi:malonyl-CoA/methylmalonyl-CoA synthetase